MYASEFVIVKRSLGGIEMEALGIVGFVFGLIALIRTEKLIKSLKEKGVLDKDYKI